MPTGAFCGADGTQQHFVVILVLKIMQTSVFLRKTDISYGEFESIATLFQRETEVRSR